MGRMAYVQLSLVRREKDPLTCRREENVRPCVASMWASQCTSSPAPALALTKPMNYRVGCTHEQPLIHTILTPHLEMAQLRSKEGQ